MYLCIHYKSNTRLQQNYFVFTLSSYRCIWKIVSSMQWLIFVHERKQKK